MPQDEKRSTSGRFITFEGSDGAGKTTQVRRLAARLEGLGRAVVAVREPGGTALGEQLRPLILPRNATTNDPAAELLLLNAARAQLVAEVIRPALARGAVVLCDRYADATLAYQGYGRGGDLAQIRAVIAVATGGLLPDRTVLLDVPPDVSRRRLEERGAENFFDRIGGEFRARVRAGFLTLAQEDPARWAIIPAAGPPDEVEARIWAALAPLFE